MYMFSCDPKLLKIDMDIMDPEHAALPQCSGAGHWRFRTGWELSSLSLRGLLAVPN